MVEAEIEVVRAEVVRALKAAEAEWVSHLGEDIGDDLGEGREALHLRPVDVGVERVLGERLE